MTFYPSTPQHFSIFSKWGVIRKRDLKGKKDKIFIPAYNVKFSDHYFRDYSSFYVDRSTGEIYNGDGLWLIRIKCIQLLLLSPISQFLAILYKMIALLWQIITFAVFFSDTYTKLSYLQKTNAYLIDILHFLIMPAAILLLFCC